MTTKEHIENYLIQRMAWHKTFGFILTNAAESSIWLSYAEKACEDAGFTVKRIIPKNGLTPHSDIFCKDKLIGYVDIQGFISIIMPKKFIKHAKLIAQSDSIIIPEKRVHGILGWHSVKGKFHILSNDIALHFELPEISESDIRNVLEKIGSLDRIDEFKEIEATRRAEYDKAQEKK